VSAVVVSPVSSNADARQPDEPIYAFPPGFRMVAGNPSSNTYDENDSAQKAIGYICWRSGGVAGPRLPSEQPNEATMRSG